MHAVADRVARRLVARDGQQQDEHAELVGAEVPLALGRHQLRHDVLGRALLALGGQVHGVADELHRRLGADLLGDRVLRVVVGDHLVRPVEDPRPVLLRYADQLGDGLEREFAGHLGDEVEAAVGRGRHGLLDDLQGAFPQGLFQPADGPRGEAALHDLADAGVFRRIHVQHDQTLGIYLFALDVLVEADDRGVGGGGEQFRVRGDVFDVRVPGHDPVALVVEAGDAPPLRAPPHRCRLPQLSELRERDAALEQVGVGGVEAVGQRGTGHRGNSKV